MITEASDVETLLSRFHPGLILVGPLISTYRYFDTDGNPSAVFHSDLTVIGPLSFDIAGDGSKVYEIVNLGFGKAGTNAQGQRAEFVKKLESRFAEVMTFGSLLEMVHAVHEYWPNDETAKVLAFAGRGTKFELTEVAGPHETVKDRSSASLTRQGGGEQSVDAAGQPRPDGGEQSADAAGLSQPDSGEQPVDTRESANLVKDIDAISEYLDEIAGAESKLEPSVRLEEMPSPPVAGARSFAPVALRPFAVGAAVALVAWMLPINRDGVPPAVAPTASPSVHNQPAEANEPTRSASAFVIEPQPPPSQPSEVASTQAASGPSAPAEASGAASRPAARETALLVNRATDFFMQGDYASARPLLRRAAEVGSASAALMLGATYDPFVVRPIGGFGTKPDIALARHWYEKAVELGSDAASQQLAKLAQTGEPPQ